MFPSQIRATEIRNTAKVMDANICWPAETILCQRSFGSVVSATTLPIVAGGGEMVF